MKRSILPRLVAAALCSSTLCTALIACSTESASVGQGYARDADTLVLSVVPDQPGAEANWQPLVDYIEQATAKHVELVESVSYAALVEASLAGHVDLSIVSAFTYVAAKNRGAEVTPVAAIVEGEGEALGYDSLAVVPSTSDITELSQFRGRRVCFVDYGSTSGYLYPSAALIGENIDPIEDITPVIAGNHNLSAQKTAQGVECDAGFAQQSVVEKTGVENGLFADGDLRVVSRQHIPAISLSMSTRLPSAVQDSLREELSSLTVSEMHDEGIAMNDGFLAQFYSFEPVTDAYFDDVRTVCEKTHSPQCAS